MAIRKVEAQRDILTEAADVWAVLVDLGRSPKVLRSVDAVDLSAFAALEGGAVWGETRRNGGRTESSFVRVLALETNKTLLLAFEDSGTTYKVLYSLLPSSLGTRLRVEVTWEAGGLAGLKGLVSKSPARATKQILDEDLEDYARAAEDRVRR